MWNSIFCYFDLHFPDAIGHLLCPFWTLAIHLWRNASVFVYWVIYLFYWIIIIMASILFLFLRLETNIRSPYFLFELHDCPRASTVSQTPQVCLPFWIISVKAPAVRTGAGMPSLYKGLLFLYIQPQTTGCHFHLLKQNFHLSCQPCLDPHLCIAWVSLTCSSQTLRRDFLCVWKWMCVWMCSRALRYIPLRTEFRVMGAVWVNI